MKRIIMLVFALALVAAWSVPAMAEVSFDGQYRLRGETKNNADFNDDTGDRKTYYGQRVRLSGTATPADDVTVKLTVQDTRTWGQGMAGSGGPSLTDASCAVTTFDETVLGVDINGDGDTLDTAAVGNSENCNSLDLHESYVKIDNVLGYGYDVTLGRQELSYGDQRLIGAFGWHNNGRSFDAIKVHGSNDKYDLDVFAAKVGEGVTGSNDQDLYGVYATIKTLPNDTALELYVLLLKDGGQDQFITNGDGALLAGVASDQELYTYGLRVAGTANVIDYTFEVATQDGSIDDATGAIESMDVGGLAYALTLGYAIPENANNIKLGLQYLHADGDDDPNDGDNNTFSNLFPTNHGTMGYADQQGWRNVDAWSVSVKGDVDEKLSLSLAYWDFQLDAAEDAWYGAGDWMNASGATSIRGGSDLYSEGEMGTEIDFTAKYKYSDVVGLQFGYSAFSAGDGLDERTNAINGVDADDLDYAYLQLTANF